MAWWAWLLVGLGVWLAIGCAVGFWLGWIAEHVGRLFEGP